MSQVRTLIVEDNQVILDNLVATLEELTEVQVVGTTADEAGAVQWIRDRPQGFDLMIIDILLQRGSGLGVLRLAADAQLGARRVVLTNYATREMRERCKALGAVRTFDKSSELDELIAYCRRLGDGQATIPGELR